MVGIRILGLAAFVVVVLCSAALGELTAGTQSTPASDAAKLRNPIPYSEESMSAGKELYLRYCTDCHGLDGKAMATTVADATNLTDPELWFGGTTEGDIFTAIRDGAGVGMPGFSFDIEDEQDIWHLVNYIHSLWPVERRPRAKLTND
jgi:mono/diheme cytochrome c family protein